MDRRLRRDRAASRGALLSLQVGVLLTAACNSSSPRDGEDASTDSTLPRRSGKHPAESESGPRNDSGLAPATPPSAAPPEGGPAGALSSPGAFATPPAAPETTIRLAFAGDVLPHGHVLDAPVPPLFAALPSWWSGADARIVNLEAPIGDGTGLEGMALAAPVSWLRDVAESLHPTALVAANNHGCDLGPAGVTATYTHAAELGIPLVGLAPTTSEKIPSVDLRDSASSPHADASPPPPPGDPWIPVRIAQKSGRTACLIAWTAFLNDAGADLSNPKVRGCVKGTAGARLAYLPLGPNSVRAVQRILGSPARFEGCDARIAYVHAGNEYRPQIDLALDQARAAAPFVDAIVFSHPHVPDGIELVGARSTGARLVPVFRSLGNFVSNQGAEWTPDETAGIARKAGEPDQSRTGWTRVGMLAQLELHWLPGADSRYFELRYGFALQFTDRAGATLSPRTLPSGPEDPVAAKLRQGPRTFAGLLDDPCRISAASGELPCTSRAPAASQTTNGTTTSP